MPDFYKFLMRHGEHAVQDLIERIERYEGITAESIKMLSLEERWVAVMCIPPMAKAA